MGTGGIAATAGVLDISDIIRYLEHDKLSSISQLIKGKSKDIQKLLKFFNGTTTSASNILLSFSVPSIIFILYSKDLLFIVVFFYY